MKYHLCIAACILAVFSISAVKTSIPLQVKPSIPVSGDAIKAIYMGSRSAGRKNWFLLADKWKKAGGNAAVMDIKETDGYVPFAMDNALRHGSRNGDAIIKKMHETGLYVIARICVFRDHTAALRRPGWALKVSGKGPSKNWMDPGSAGYFEYVVALACEAQKWGADEIQLDYFRFPVRSEIGGSIHVIGKKPRHEQITDFLARFRKRLSGSGNARLSVDVFGISAWARKNDRERIGQDIAALAMHCDVICPMIYPSHYSNGFGGYSDPAQNHRQLVTDALQKTKVLVSPTSAVVRPWLQAFSYKVLRYNAEYIQGQIQASEKCGTAGWMMWNPALEYSALFRAVRGEGKSVSLCRARVLTNLPICARFLLN